MFVGESARFQDFRVCRLEFNVSGFPIQSLCLGDSGVGFAQSLHETRKFFGELNSERRPYIFFQIRKKPGREQAGLGGKAWV